MKKFLITLFLMIGLAISANAQLYAPCYAYYQGIGYFTLPNGYYYGWISGGYPQGEGYCYCIDPQLGAVFYHGYFDHGLVHGQGELMSMSGYICGTWNHGEFVSQTNVSPSQMQQSYNNVWNNYSNYYAPTYNYPTTYDWTWNTTPSYNYPNYQATNNIKIPDNTTITQIDSDTELGRQLLGKISR